MARVPELAPRRYRFLVFDWDGTLVDSTTMIAEALRSACLDLDIDVPELDTARHVIGLGLVDSLRHVAPTLAPERYRDLAARYRHHYIAGEAAIPLFAGMHALLAELDGAGFLLGVATGKSRAGLDRQLEQHRLSRRFVATRCADEGFPKPNPDMLLHLMRHMGTDPKETLMIGDTTHDVELARNAGVCAVAVSYGAHPTASLAEGGALAVVHSVEELRVWLGENA